jgi:hypothetical protein
MTRPKSKSLDIKNLCYQQYICEPASRRFKQFDNNTSLEKIFDYLASEEQVECMIRATEVKRPAMEALIDTIESQFISPPDFDLDKNHRHRQILGSMIRFIMGHYGYMPGPAKALKKGSFVKTAIVYKRYEGLSV